MNSDLGGESEAALAVLLDAAHERARQAYAARDVAAYMALFHPELEYMQRDGKTIGHAALMRDVRAQLARMENAESSFRRASLESRQQNRACEVLEQSATYSVRAFGIVHNEWHVQRRGRYEWLLTDSGWRVRRVEVLSESIARARTWMAF